MVWYWPSFFWCVYGLRWSQAIGPYNYARNKTQANIQPPWLNISLVNKRYVINKLYEKRTVITSCRTQRVIPDRQNTCSTIACLHGYLHVITVQDSVHLVSSQSQPYNKNMSNSRWNIIQTTTTCTLFLSSLDVEDVRSKGTWCEPMTAFLWQEHSHHGNVCHQHTGHRWNKWIW